MPRKKYDEKAIIKLLRRNTRSNLRLSYQKIANEIGCSQTLVGQVATRNNIKPPDPGPKYDYDKIAKLVSEGMTTAQIRAKVGCGRWVVGEVKSQMKTAGKEVPKYAGAGKSSYAKDEVLALLKHKPGLSDAEGARKLKIADSTFAKRRAELADAGLLPDTIETVMAKSEEHDRKLEYTRELKNMTAAANRLASYEKILKECLGAYEPTPLVRPTIERSDLPTHEWGLVLSDWHTGQQTRIEETGGMYHQDVETTRRQVVKIWESLVEIKTIESAGRNIRRLHNFVLGDLTEHDDLRPSQHRKVEDVFTVQTVQAFDLLTWLIRQELTIFDFVEVDMIGGNHDRISRNRGDAGLGELGYTDTMAWLMGAFMERLFAPDIASGRLKIRNWETFFGYKEILGYKCVFEHGASFPWSAFSYGGVPWYGVQNLGVRYQTMLGEANLVLLGHGHRPAIIPLSTGWIGINGALPPSSNYAQATFKSIQRPLQWLLSIHHEMGLTGFTPIYCDVPGQLQPGQVWDDPEYHADLASGKSRRNIATQNQQDKKDEVS